MTALAADLNVLSRPGTGGDLRSYLMADNVKIYKGAVVVIDSAGYLRPARNNATDRVVAGIADEFQDNTLTGHAAGLKRCRVQSDRHFLLLCSATASQASVGTPFYALDDQTVRATIGNGNTAGMVTEYVDATHIWVFIPTPTPAQVTGSAVGGAVAGLKMAAGRLTTVTATDTVVTGLATVTSVVVSYETDPADANTYVSATIGDQAGTPAAGSVIIKTWKQSGTDPTPIAADAFSKVVNWIAVGT